MSRRRATNPGVYIVKGDRFSDPYGDGTRGDRNAITDDNKIGFEDLPISADGKRAKYKRKWYEIHDTPWYSGVHRVQAIFPYSKNPATWTAKQERQYKAIEKSEMKRGASKKTAQRIAAATVNKRRAANPSPATIGKYRKRLNAYRAAGWSLDQMRAGMWKAFGLTLDSISGDTAHFAGVLGEKPFTVSLKGRASKNPSPAQIRARKAFAKMAKERSKAAKSKRARNPRYIIRATDAGGNERELAILQSPNKMQAVARAKSLYKGHKKYTAELIDKDDFIGGRAGTQRLKRKRTRKANGVAKTAGKALKKIGGAVLGGVSKVAGKGAKALKNPSKEEHDFYRKMLALIAQGDSGAAQAATVSGRRLGYTFNRIQKDIQKAKEKKKNPKRRRNLDHPDSSHHIKVHQHWRAGGLSQWQRAAHAGQHDLFSHGIKLKPKRNGKRNPHFNVYLETTTKDEYGTRTRESYVGMFYGGTKAEAIKEARRSHYPGKLKAGTKLIARLSEYSKEYERNPSAAKIRKKFAGRVSGHKTLYFPKGAPNGMAKLGRLVSMKLKGGKVIKPARRNPAPEIWLCCDTRGKLWLGSTKPGRLYDGAPGDLGTMTNIEYSESKPHLGYPDQTIWFHKLGEVSGRQPHLVVNDDGDLIIKGGAYKITRAGIVD